MAHRNPRRAYERDGTMIVPPTVGEARDASGPMAIGAALLFLVLIGVGRWIALW